MSVIDLSLIIYSFVSEINLDEYRQEFYWYLLKKKLLQVSFYLVLNL